MIRRGVWTFCFCVLTPVFIAEDAKISNGRPSYVGNRDSEVGGPVKSTGLGISSVRDGQPGVVPTIADESTQADLLKSLRDSLGDYKTVLANRPPKTELWRDGGNSSKYHLEHAPPACHLEPETGLCRAFIPRWYFNASDETCYKFTYGGCQGNENNFHKEHKCYATCKGEIPCPTDPEKVCRLTESPCGKANCPAQPEAECAVLPCTCEAVFEDSSGEIVKCNLPVSDEADKISEAPIGGLSKTSYVADVYEGRSARPESKNKTFTEFEVDDPQGTKKKPAPNATETSVNETMTTNSESKIPANDKKKFIDKDDSDASVTVTEDGEIENDTENYVTDYTTVTTTENAHNVTVPPSPKTPGNIRLIGVLVTLGIIALLAIGFIAYKKWRGVMEFHYRTRGASVTEDRQCFTSSGGTGYGSGI